MDDWYKNPWIIGGGLGLIALLYIVSNSGNSNAGGITPAGIAALNAQAGQMAVQQSQISASYGAALAQADSANFGTFASALSAMTQANASVGAALDQSVAGTISNALSSNAMVAAASVGASGRVSAEGESAMAQTAISKNSANASIAQSHALEVIANSSMWGGIVNSLAHVAPYVMAA